MSDEYAPTELGPRGPVGQMCPGATGLVGPKGDVFVPAIPWPDPTPEMFASPEFEAVWQCIKSWDINVPQAYHGYCGANGNHVRAILDALKASEQK